MNEVREIKDKIVISFLGICNCLFSWVSVVGLHLTSKVSRAIEYINSVASSTWLCGMVSL